MAQKPAPRKEIIQLVQEQQVSTAAKLAKTFKCTKRTIFRVLGEIGYHISYNKNGEGLTLISIPIFDKNGLWECKEFHFSQWGTLAETIQHIIDNSGMGLTPAELRAILQHDNIYHHLTKLTNKKQIVKDKTGRKPIYYSIEPKTRNEQKKARKSWERENKTLKVTSFEIEKVHFGYLAQLLLSEMVTAEDIYTMLKNMGKKVEPQELKELIIRYDLQQKKTRIELVPRKPQSQFVPTATRDKN